MLPGLHRSPRTLRDRVVAITGAGGGMGREMALLAAGRGAVLALSDWDAAALAGTVELVRARGADVHGAVVDVSDRAAVAGWAVEVVDRFGRVDVLVNNAGVSMSGHFEEMSYEEFDWIVGVNLHGVVHGTKEFLPHLIASGDGVLVNISSLFGLISMPGQTAYNATKYAVRGFTEALREEMLVSRHPVSVTCVHPGGIRTGIVRNGRSTVGEDHGRLTAVFDEKLAKMPADRAARIILDGALAGRARVLVGADAHLMHHFAKLTGSRYQDVVARLAPRLVSTRRDGQEQR